MSNLIVGLVSTTKNMMRASEADYLLIIILQ